MTESYSQTVSQNKLAVTVETQFNIYSKPGLSQTGVDVKGSTVNECRREAAMRKSDLNGNNTQELTHALFSPLIN